MPLPIAWTTELDHRLLRLRADGLAWAECAAVLGLSRSTVAEHGRRLGAARPPRPPAPPLDLLARPPLPAGHPISWGLLNAGTVLEGEAWPDA